MIGDRAKSILRQRQEQADANRAAMPQTALWLDQVRAMGFPGARVKFATEGGVTVGRISGNYEVTSDKMPLKPYGAGGKSKHESVAKGLKAVIMKKAQELLFA